MLMLVVFVFFILTPVLEGAAMEAVLCLDDIIDL